jgi:hypothetical protein
MPKLFVATLGRGLLRSDDLGRTWSTDPGVPATARLHSIQAGPRELAVGGEGTVHRYRDRAWSPMLPPGGSDAVSAITLVAGAVLVAVDRRGLLRSGPSGLGWEPLGPVLPPASPGDPLARVSALLPNPAVARELWGAVESAGVFASDDGGLAWSPASDALASLDVHALAWSSGGVLVAGTSAGVAVWRSARWVAGRLDGWFDSATRCCRALAGRPDDPGTLYGGVGGETGGRGSVAVSRDGGRSWSACALPGEPAPIRAVGTGADLPGLVVAASAPGEVYVSLDAAATWRHVLSAGVETTAVACLAD